MANVNEAAELVLEAFGAVERRDRDALERLYHPEVEFHWPPSLPYGGSSRGGEVFEPGRPTWGECWDPFQPTEMERAMDPRVVAASDSEVVVLWRQRAVDPAGERLDVPVLGLYGVRAARFARAQMFYFDTLAVASFLARARSVRPAPPAIRR